MKKIFVLCLLLGISIFGFLGIEGTANATVYTYEYTLQAYGQANPIKSLLIELSGGTTVSNISSTPGTSSSIGTFTSTELPSLPGATYGINFTVDYATGAHQLYVKFESTGAPVLGSFFANNYGTIDPGKTPGFQDYGFAYNNTALGFYIPRPDGGGTPAVDLVGLLTNIDGNSVGAYPPGNRINEDSGLYVAGDRWYYQANDCTGSFPGDPGSCDDDGWVQLSWKVTDPTRQVPEPATLLLLGLGLVGVGAYRRKS